MTSARSAWQNTLELPREADGLATGRRAVRRLAPVLTEFLADAVDEATADGLVLVLDGTVDSAVAATIAAEAVDPGDVVGLVLPATITWSTGAQAAEAVGAALDIQLHRLQLHTLVLEFQDLLDGVVAGDVMATQNARRRLRMVCAYYVANAANGLVVGSTTRAASLLGSLTKYGDTAVDLALLADLYRSEVGALANHLGVPTDLDVRPAEAVAPPDAARLGISPRYLDAVCRLALDEGREPSAVADRLGVDPAVVETVREWAAETAHKRRAPRRPSWPG